MSGHSKWSNIKNKKAVNDAARGSVFTKLAKALTVAARTGHGMSLAIEKAKSASMPKENIDRAIDKGMGKGGVELAELVIEGFAPGGVGIIIEAVTDSRNRTMVEIRLLMEKYGGRIGEMGSVMYMFEKTEGKYVAKYTVTADESEKVRELLDVLSEHDDVQEVYANLG